ncbi:hypothetical protein CCHR01_19264 [Colletotrichum chrysophilum]|uniref:FAD/NAD(P)-binding domain-containing protein n=1 Tax=Colletotrichum chrysophilum TaxID=1836956 RepID=A0AAD9A2Y6_9PEZI|nr:hypothetical protein CCHR01_19264 [Colletotrichum chrysophilum]
MAAVSSKYLPRTRVSDLPSWIPHVPGHDNESTVDYTTEGNEFFNTLRAALLEERWSDVRFLFAERSFWRDCLTLTFDLRTLHGRDEIVAAWEELSQVRHPVQFSILSTPPSLQIGFRRSNLTLATLDVAFSFHMSSPAAKCLGRTQLIPKASGGWEIWILSTAIVTLESPVFGSLPRASASLIEPDQRGRPFAQGLPRVSAGCTFDAIIVGGSASGIANTIQLDSAGADVAVFDKEVQAGGNWSTRRYPMIRLNSPASDIQLPQYPVPKTYPTFLTGRDITMYISSAVEHLKLPFFGGVEVVSNTWDSVRRVWCVKLRDVQTKHELITEAKNIVLSCGMLQPDGVPNLPFPVHELSFRGITMHSSHYKSSADFRGARVVIIGVGTSAHDVAVDLASDPAVKEIKLIQRRSAILLDVDAWNSFRPASDDETPVEIKDFQQYSTPYGVVRDTLRSLFAGVIAKHKDLYDSLESKGYLIDRRPCWLTRMFDHKGRGIFIDRYESKAFDLVLKDRIQVVRGEATGLVPEGITIKGEDGEITMPADAVIFATGNKSVDLPTLYAESGFIDRESASLLQNVNLGGFDIEGEMPGMATFSGHTNLYFSGIGLHQTRWIAKVTAIQVLADITGQFPKRYKRTASR